MSEDEKRSRKCWQITSLHVMELVIEQKDPMRCVPAPSSRDYQLTAPC